jgi:hypothetical protein
MTFISMHSVIICVVFSGAYMRCTRLSSLNSGVTPAVSDQRLGAPNSEYCIVRCTTGLSGVPQRAQLFSND